MKLATLFFLISLSLRIHAQDKLDFNSFQPDEEFENIHVKKINGDSLQTTFVIWVKKNVKAHFHNEHTENIIVLEGKAEMVVNGDTLIIKKGDYLNIPMKTVHEVTKVYGKKPLKVLSIQSPYFDGTDRIFVEDQEATY